MACISIFEGLSMDQPKKFKPRLLSEVLFLDILFDSRTRPVLIYVTFIVLIGAILFRWLEGWNWIDSFYFVIITLTTIGYGDFTPSTPLTKLITIFYGINGIVVLLAFFDIIRRYRTLKITGNGRDENNSSDDN
jgi:hypothetical protein